MPTVIISPCGTSLLTNGTETVLRNLLILPTIQKNVTHHRSEQRNSTSRYIWKFRRN